MTDADRIAHVLHHRGWVSQQCFDPPDVVDGRKPIRRVAARILELRGAGYEIVSERQGDHTVRYVLVARPGVEATSHDPVQSAPPAPRAAAGGRPGLAIPGSDGTSPEPPVTLLPVDAASVPHDRGTGGSSAYDPWSDAA